MTLSSYHHPPSHVFFAFLIFLVFKGVSGSTFIFMNKCNFTVWPGISGKPDLGSTGFELTNGSSRSFRAPTGWTGRFWARTGCKFDSSGKGSCTTRDCGSGEVNCNGANAAQPATLAEFALDQFDSLDFYVL